MPSPSSPPSRTRRAFLASVGAAGTTLAGCSTLSSLTGSRRRWTHDLHGTPHGAPVVTAGTVLVRTTGEDEGRLAAVGRGSGEEAWAVPASRGPYGLAVNEGTVLLGGRESLVGLDLDSGEQVFTVSEGTPATNHSPTLVADDSGFVVLRREGGLLALDTDGEERWRTDAGVGGPLAGGLITTVAAEYDPEDGELLALRGFRADTGEGRWRVPLDTYRLRGVGVAGDRVFTTGEEVRAYDAGDGTERWTVGLGTDEEAFTPPVFADEEGFYVGTGVRWSDRDYGTAYGFAGAPPNVGYEYRTEHGVRELATGADARLFAAVGETVRRVDTETMTTRWAVSADAHSLAAGGDTCYVTTRDGGRLLALADD